MNFTILFFFNISFEQIKSVTFDWIVLEKIHKSKITNLQGQTITNSNRTPELISEWWKKTCSDFQTVNSLCLWNDKTWYIHHRKFNITNILVSLNIAITEGTNHLSIITCTFLKAGPNTRKGLNVLVIARQLYWYKIVLSTAK